MQVALVFRKLFSKVHPRPQLHRIYRHHKASPGTGIFVALSEVVDFIVVAEIHDFGERHPVDVEVGIAHFFPIGGSVIDYLSVEGAISHRVILIRTGLQRPMRSTFFFSQQALSNT